ncbi:hypothetical protein Tco_0053102 [Tanacetum coccineum]
MLAICTADTPVVFKAPKPSSNAERVPQGTKPGAKPGHKKHLTSLKQSSVSSKEATKGGSSKAPTGSKTRHSKKRKESSSAMDSNPSQPLVSTLVDTRMYKEDQQAIGGPTPLGVTSEERANPQLSSGMSTFNLNKPIYSTSFIIHSESASGNDASVVSTAEVDPRNSAPSDFVPQQQGINEGTKNTSYDNLFAGTELHVLADQTKSVSEGLETIFTQPITGKGASSVAKQINEETSSSIKLEDLAKLVLLVQPSFKDLDSPEMIMLLLLMILMKTRKIKFMMLQMMKLKTLQFLIPYLSLLKFRSLPTSSLPTDLKDLPSKFNEMTEEVKGLKKQVHKLENELPGDLKEILTKLKDFTKTVASVQAKLKTLDALPGQADTRPTEGDKDTNQATISQIFQRRANKNIEKDNLNKNKPQTETTPPPNPPEDKGKKDLSLEEAEKESTDSDSDDETRVTSSMVEPSRIKKLKKFDFITEDGRYIHLTEEEINHQKKLEEYAKAEAAKQEGEVRKAELVDLLGSEVVKRKGPITFKVYREDGTSEIIPNFKASDLHLGKRREVMKAYPNRTGKGWETIYKQICTRMDYIHTTKAKLASSTSALQVLRRLGSIFTSVYAVKVYKAGKRLLYVKRSKAISLGNVTSKVGIEDLKPDDESVDTPLVSPFLDSDDDSDDGEVLNELEEYGNAGQLCR